MRIGRVLGRKLIRAAVLSIDASAPVDEDGTGDDALGDEVKGEVSERAKEDSSYSESSSELCGRLERLKRS